MNDRSGRQSLFGLWVGVSGLAMPFFMALLLMAVVVGQGMEKRVLALLSAPSSEFWQIDLLEVDRGIQYPLTRDNNRYGFMWSPDGEEIGFSSSLTGFTVIDWTGNNRRPMADSDGWLIPFAMGISSFNREWNASRTERVIDGDYDIFICDHDCVRRQRVTTDGRYFDASPAWSPDGQRIVFASDRGGAFLEIFVINRDGTDIRQLTYSRSYSWTPDWSADGRQIAFVATLGPDVEVFVMDADGGHLRRVTYNNQDDAYPAWQP